MAARHEEGCFEYNIYIVHVFCLQQGLSNDSVGVERGTVFQEIRPGAGFKTGVFVLRKASGRLPCKTAVVKTAPSINSGVPLPQVLLRTAEVHRSHSHRFVT